MIKSIIIIASSIIAIIVGIFAVISRLHIPSFAFDCKISYGKTKKIQLTPHLLPKHTNTHTAHTHTTILSFMKYFAKCNF